MPTRRRIALAIVSFIKLQQGTEPKAIGGNLNMMVGWDTDTLSLSPPTYRVEKLSRPYENRLVFEIPKITFT